MNIIRQIIIMGVLTGCNTTGPRFTSPGSLMAGGDQQELMVIPCYRERMISRQQLYGLPSDYSFRFTPSCSVKESLTTLRTGPRDLRVMFVLDLSSAMKASVDGVKYGIESLHSNLTAAKWNPVYGAIGYRDQGPFARISFSTLDEFRVKLSEPAWATTGGGDLPEAGQDAIAEGVKALADAPKGDGASVLVFTTNAPSYRNQSDFSVTDLAAGIKAQASGIDDFAFFSAADSATPRVSGAPIPLDQMKQLRAATGFLGAELTFPFSAEGFFGEFTRRYDPQGQHRDLSCLVNQVTLASLPNQGAEGTATVRNVYSLSEAGYPIKFDVPDDPATIYYDMTIDRCCKLELTAQNCFRQNRSVIRFQFTPRR